MPYVKTKVAKEFFGVDVQTLRTWGDEGRIEIIKGRGGHRLYNIESFIKRESINTSKEIVDKKKYIYCRVSSNKQKEDLERQVKYLSEKYPGHTVVKEIASGINFKRKGLQRILDEITHGNVEEIVVANRDRLCRIAWEHFKWLFDRYGVNIVVDCQENKTSTTEQELAEDLLSIIHVFSSRHYGQRRQYTKKRISTTENQDTEDSGTQDSIEEEKE
jgi:predicted site-specific integrase-resolvase